MVTPIIKQTKTQKRKEISISQERFNDIIKRVYDIMLAYGNFEGRLITKVSPIMVGNVKFWFERDKEKDTHLLRFSPSVHGWDEKSMEVDLEQHFHEIFFSRSNTPRY